MFLSIWPVYSCSKCDTEIILNIHKDCHVANSNRLQCCYCGKDAPSAKAWYGLYIHMVNKHPAHVPAPHYCHVCSKSAHSPTSSLSFLEDGV